MRREDDELGWLWAEPVVTHFKEQLPGGKYKNGETGKSS
jgi:hypothetical protein